MECRYTRCDTCSTSNRDGSSTATLLPIMTKRQRPNFFTCLGWARIRKLGDIAESVGVKDMHESVWTVESCSSLHILYMNCVGAMQVLMMSLLTPSHTISKRSTSADTCFRVVSDHMEIAPNTYTSKSAANAVRLQSGVDRAYHAKPRLEEVVRPLPPAPSQLCRHDVLPQVSLLKWPRGNAPAQDG